VSFVRTAAIMAGALAMACNNAAQSSLGDARGAEDAGEADSGSTVLDAALGPDFGVDAGPGPDLGSAPDAAITWIDAGACGMPSDCSGTPAPVSFCQAPVLSCIEGLCVSECAAAPRSCILTQRIGCIQCSGATPACPTQAAACLLRQVSTVHVDSATCPTFPGTNVPFPGSNLTIERTSPTECDFTAHLAASPANLGQLYQLDDGTFLGQFPGLGGTCVGTMAPTDAIHIVFTCPDCSFVLSP
jgi:hypothetical protein